MKALLARLRTRLPRPRLRLRRPSDELLEDAALVAGLAAIAAGCGWIFPPAAPIVGGLFLAALGWRAAAGGEDERRPTRTVERWYSDPSEEEDED